MSLDRKNLIQLAKIVTNANPTSGTKYSFNNETYDYSVLNETLRNEFKELAGTPALYRENKNTIFSIIEEVIDDVLPKQVMAQYGDFAEVKTFAQGDKPVFIQKITAKSKRRARKFITKVGLAGRYEVFKLDGTKIEVPTSAYGGAAQIGFEEYLDGTADWAALIDAVNEGLDYSLYSEIEKALIASIATLPVANKFSGAGFNEAIMDSLLAVADSYGPATIYCTFDFAATMIPANSNAWSDNMKDTKWNNGYLGNYKGHRVVVLNQSFTDETNAVKVIDPSHAWIIPAGTDGKPVKIALEGQTCVRESENEDWSRDIQVYKKMGVATLGAYNNNMCVYTNTNLVKEVSLPYQG